MRFLLPILLTLAMLNVLRGFRFTAGKITSKVTSFTNLQQERNMNIKNSVGLSMSQSANAGLLSVHVTGLISPGQSSSDEFYMNTLQNARKSILEDGISRFDVLNRIDNNEEFLLVEVYNSETGPADHKLTSHYNSWRENVASLMAQPRSASKYTTLFPPRNNWKTDVSASVTGEEYHMKKFPWKQTPFASDIGSPAPSSSMLAVAVDVEVTEGGESAFIQATLENARNSVKEPGVSRFDFMQNVENPRNFLLFEVYNNVNGPTEHKATAHYVTWAATVKDLMERPRTAIRYATRFPAPLYWHRNSYFTHPCGSDDSGAGEGGEGEEEEGGSRGLSAVKGNAFGFLSPKISMGRGIAVAAIQEALKDLNIKNPYIVTGKGGFNRLKDSLLIPCGAVKSTGEHVSVFCVAGEPTVEDARQATAAALSAKCDGVLCVGGGSALDLGKAVAALITNTGDVYDYLEIVGKGLPITNKPVPLIAVPTTSGTGSECTKNAVLKSSEHGRKASMRHDSMLPAIAVIDPCLSVSCPQQVTVHVGLDALCQLIEPYVSNAANPITDALAKEGITRAARSLRPVVANGCDIAAREDMAVASVLGGLCLANAKLGVVHGYAAVLGGMFESAPHGSICAVLLPHVFSKNAQKLEELARGGSADAKRKLYRFTEVSRMITGLPTATVHQGVAWLEILVKDLDVPSLSNVCPVTKDQLPAIALSTAGSSSTKGNPIELSVAELEEILIKAF